LVKEVENELDVSFGDDGLSTFPSFCSNISGIAIALQELSDEAHADLESEGDLMVRCALIQGSVKHPSSYVLRISTHTTWANFTCAAKHISLKRQGAVNKGILKVVMRASMKLLSFIQNPKFRDDLKLKVGPCSRKSQF